MTQLLWSLILAFVMAPVVGCAYVEERFQEDTGKPAFEVGYRAGEMYRLRTDGRIVSVFSNGTGRLELWSPRLVARNAEFPDHGRLVAIVPSGSVVRVDGLEHNYTFAIPPVPGDSQILRAYGTVETGSGRWAHVRIPDDQDAKWSFVAGTIVMAFPPDHDFLELVTSPTRVERP